MADTAIALGEIATNVENLKLQSYLHGTTQVWTNAYLDDIAQLQALALDGDGDALAYLAANRAFILIGDASPIDLEMGGVVFTFTGGSSVYCCSPAEAGFFIQEALNLGFDVTPSDAATFASSGIAGVFFE